VAEVHLVPQLLAGKTQFAFTQRDRSHSDAEDELADVDILAKSKTQEYVFRLTHGFMTVVDAIGSGITYPFRKSKSAKRLQGKATDTVRYDTVSEKEFNKQFPGRHQF
jgi:hypothetical protein